MPHASGEHHATAIDFATRTVFGAEITEDDRNECLSTLRELVESFGSETILHTVTSMGIGLHEPGHERVMQALRAFCVLILESERPKLTAQLIGKLVHLELATGRRIHMRALGLQYGISKQAVSNRLKLYAARLSLPRPDSQPHTRQAHRLMNRRNYGNRTQPTIAPQRDVASAG